MKRQRNTAQMKEQDRNTQDQINEEEIGKPSEREFRVMIIKMSQTLEKEWRHTLRRHKKCLTQS